MFKNYNISLREQKHAQTKIALVRAAQERMQEKRLKDISVKEICEAIPVSEVTFYNYFPQKTDLLLYSVQLMSVELAWHIKQWEKEKSNLELIETMFDFIARTAEEKPLVVSEAIMFFVRKRQKPSFEGLSVAECLIAFPDLRGIEQVQSSPLEMREFLRPYLESAVERGELPKNTDIETIAIMLEALHIGMLMKLHLKGAMRIRSMYHKQLQLIWDGLWAQSPEGHPFQQPEVEFVLN